MRQVVTYQKSQLQVPKHKAFNDLSEEPSSSGAQESSKINATSQEPSYPQINIGRRKVDDEANDEVNNETANMATERNKKFPCHRINPPSQPPKNQVDISNSKSHPKIPETTPDDPPLLPVQSSEPECASSTFGYNEEPTVLLSGSHVRPSSVMDISSDDGGSMPESDMPNQLIPEARPGDLLYVWDATQVDTLLWSLPDQGADPSEELVGKEAVPKTFNDARVATAGPHPPQKLRPLRKDEDTLRLLSTQKKTAKSSYVRTQRKLTAFTGICPWSGGIQDQIKGANVRAFIEQFCKGRQFPPLPLDHQRETSTTEDGLTRLPDRSTVGSSFVPPNVEDSLPPLLLVFRGHSVVWEERRIVALVVLTL
ncbi:hypothetical protein BS47DRAFT_1398528 [Hydnum rufescens UP504]|uniref:Uncharacterized protein n=1 Tax=Hydnum rufescens UP504 TaxID=1448309 RepID=A0A9P6AMI9_9AGAM|nr:hypothetical protein BS47DRAFT_1398528 [Hydnum rufescens UP504]